MADSIEFPKPTPPAPGQLLDVAPGIKWARFALPFLLDHVNIYLVEDDGGWAAIDTGIGLEATQQAWEAIFAGPLHGQRLTRILCTHYHPDHVGQVGWLAERFGCPLWMSRTEYLFTLALQHRGFAANPDFYAERGLTGDAAATVASNGHAYLRLITGLPTQVHRLQAGQTLRIGGRDFAVHTGGGHAPEQAMLACASDNVFLSADQVLTRISPNISVQSMEPEADPLGEYLRSLQDLQAAIPAGALVLPGHHLPFTGLHTRLAELALHHESRCALIAEACRAEPSSAADLLPILFKRDMDAHQTGFAFSEVLAHVNHMRTQGSLIQQRDETGILRLHTA